MQTANHWMWKWSGMNGSEWEWWNSECKTQITGCGCRCEMETAKSPLRVTKRLNARVWKGNGLEVSKTDERRGTVNAKCNALMGEYEICAAVNNALHCVGQNVSPQCGLTVKCARGNVKWMNKAGSECKMQNTNG